MTLPYRLIIPSLILFTSCKSRNAATTGRDTTTTSPDTAKVITKDTADDNSEIDYPTRYVEHARLDLPDHIIALTSRFAVVNGEVDEGSHLHASSNYFVHIDKKTRKADTVKAGLDNLGGCFQCTYIIRDMTDSFQLKSLVVQIVTPAEDIYYTNSFVGIKDGKFKKLFSIMDTRENGIQLRRQGTQLVGYMAGRDEVVEDVEHNYPVTINTTTFENVSSLPDRQYIGYETHAIESFRAHRVIDGRTDSSLVAVKAGTELTVDTIYRSLGKVRLLLKDSVKVEIRIETGKEKLQHNAAG